MHALTGQLLVEVVAYSLFYNHSSDTSISVPLAGRVLVIGHTDSQFYQQSY
jgi:hypothetical protein